jgi:peptide/nickel transport system substrate-binding protein
MFQQKYKTIHTGPRPSGLSTDPSTFVKTYFHSVGLLDPAVTYETRSAEVLFNVYERLVALDATSPIGIGPALAKDLPTVGNGGISRDGRKYRFRIRRGVRFHTGDELTPEDVKYSLQRLLITDHQGGPTWLLADPLLGRESLRNRRGILQVEFEEIDRAITVDGDDVVFRLPEPFAPFPAVLATPATSILCKRWCVERGEWSGTADTWEDHVNPSPDRLSLGDETNGTGPFSLGRFDAQSLVILDRFEHYWRGAAKLEQVHIVREDDPDKRLERLATGATDVGGVDRPRMEKVMEIPGLVIYDELPTFTCDVMSFNFHVNPDQNPYIGSGVFDGDGIPPHFFSDVHVRRAFNYSFDFERYLEQATRRICMRIPGPIPAGIFGHNPDNPVFHRDARRAEEEFRQAHGGQVWRQGFRLTIGSRIEHYANRVSSEILKQNVEALNPAFHIDIVDLDPPLLLRTVEERRLPIYVAGWLADYMSPHNFVQPIMSSFGNWARMQGYYNPEAEALIREGVRSTEEEDRRTAYFRLQEIAYEDAIDIFCNQSRSWIPMRDWVKGWVYHPQLGPHAIQEFYPLWKELD